MYVIVSDFNIITIHYSVAKQKKISIFKNYGVIRGEKIALIFLYQLKYLYFNRFT